MPFDPWWIMTELAVGGAGFVLFTYGKRQERVPQLVAGLLLMAFPFFVTSVSGLLVGSVLLSTATWWAIRHGW